MKATSLVRLWSSQSAGEALPDGLCADAHVLLLLLPGLWVLRGNRGWDCFWFATPAVLWGWQGKRLAPSPPAELKAKGLSGQVATPRHCKPFGAQPQCCILVGLQHSMHRSL